MWYAQKLSMEIPPTFIRGWIWFAAFVGISLVWKGNWTWRNSNKLCCILWKKQAICVKNDLKIVGIMLFSRKHNMICCLAVSPEY